MLAAAGVVGPTLALSALLCILCSSGAYHRRLVLPGCFLRFFFVFSSGTYHRRLVLAAPPPPPHSLYFFCPLLHSPALPLSRPTCVFYLSICSSVCMMCIHDMHGVDVCDESTPAAPALQVLPAWALFSCVCCVCGTEIHK